MTHFSRSDLVVLDSHGVKKIRTSDLSVDDIGVKALGLLRLP